MTQGQRGKWVIKGFFSDFFLSFFFQFFLSPNTFHAREREGERISGIERERERGRENFWNYTHLGNGEGYDDITCIEQVLQQSDPHVTESGTRSGREEVGI